MSLLHRVGSRLKSSIRRIVGRRGESYWASRKKLRYYAEVVRMARTYAPHADSVLDVGPYQTTFVADLSWIRRKAAIDLLHLPVIPGVECIQGDFLQYDPPAPYDLVICLQVLEHLDAPEPFARKLLATGKTVIVSVPYRWPKGQCTFHVQDPVDEAMVRSWMGRDWLEHTIVEDAGAKRLVAVFGPTA